MGHWLPWVPPIQGGGSHLLFSKSRRVRAGSGSRSRPWGFGEGATGATLACLPTLLRLGHVPGLPKPIEDRGDGLRSVGRKALRLEPFADAPDADRPLSLDD